MNVNDPKRRASAITWNEADTCRKFVVPKLQAAGWDDDPHSNAEQRTFTDKRVVIGGNQVQRQKPKRVLLAMVAGTGRTVVALQVCGRTRQEQADRINRMGRIKKRARPVLMKSNSHPLPVSPVHPFTTVAKNQITGKFGGEEGLREAVRQQQNLLHTQ